MHIVLIVIGLLRWWCGSSRKWAMWSSGLLIKCVLLMLVGIVWLSIWVVPIFRQGHVICFPIAIHRVRSYHTWIIRRAFEQFLHSPLLFLSSPLPARVKDKTCKCSCNNKNNSTNSGHHCSGKRIISTVVRATGC